MGRLVRICALMVVVLLLSGCLSHFGIIPPPDIDSGKPPLVLLFDVGPGPVAEGYTQVTCGATYSPTTGFGWAPGGAPSDERNRSYSDPLLRDFCNHLTTLELLVDVPNGWYDVTVISGDATASQAQTTFIIEGITRDTRSAGSGSFLELIWPVEVTDGQLNIRLEGTNTVRLNGVRIVERSGPPEA